MNVWFIIALLGILALSGAPLFTIIAAIGIIAFANLGTDTSAMIAELYRLVDLPALIAIPLFTFAGFLLAESQAPRPPESTYLSYSLGLRCAMRSG